MRPCLKMAETYLAVVESCVQVWKSIDVRLVNLFKDWVNDKLVITISTIDIDIFLLTNKYSLI